MGGFSREEESSLLKKLESEGSKLNLVERRKFIKNALLMRSMQPYLK